MSTNRPLIVKLSVGVGAEQHCAHLRQHLLGQHVQTRLQGVGDLDAVPWHHHQLNTTTAVHRRRSQCYYYLQC